MDDRFKQRFIQDFDLPINVTEEPYFSYLLDLYDPIYNSKKLYQFYQETINKYGSETKFFAEYNIMVSKIRNTLNFFNAFKEFNQLKLKQNKILTKTTKLYESRNVDKLYYSLDLKQANFHALKYTNPILVCNANDYNTFLKNFTYEEYFYKSKNFRMLILKQLSIKNVLTIERDLLNELLKIVLKYYHKGKVRVLLFDEILIEIKDIPDITDNDEFIKELNTQIKKMKIEINAGFFKLEKIEPYDYYVRKYTDGTIKFKAIPRQYLPQVYKHYVGLDINDLDILTVKGKKAKILEFEEE